jgi:hypothetical protein
MVERRTTKHHPSLTHAELIKNNRGKCNLVSHPPPILRQEFANNGMVPDSNAVSGTVKPNTISVSPLTFQWGA